MGQTPTCLHYHLVFSTKDRVAQITADLRDRLYEYMGGVINRERGRLAGRGAFFEPFLQLAQAFFEFLDSGAKRLIHRFALLNPKIARVRIDAQVNPPGAKPRCPKDTLWITIAQVQNYFHSRWPGTLAPASARAKGR